MKKVKYLTAGVLLVGSISSLVIWQTGGSSSRATALQPPEITRTAGLSVDTVTLNREQLSKTLKANGELHATKETTLGSRVGGRVVAISEAFENGLYVEKGTVLLSIEKLDYEVAVTNAQQSVADAQVALLTQQAASKSAEEDWFSYNQTQPDPLAVQQPQLDAAKLRYESALIRQDLAERNLSATEVKAPFSGWITSRNIQQGDWVHVGHSVGRIIAKAPLRGVLKLSPAQVSDLNNERLDEVTVSLVSNGRTITSKGLTIAPVTDQATRQTEAYTYVSPIQNDGLRLRPGTFFEAAISLGQKRELIRVPESAITKRGTFFVVDNGIARETSLSAGFSAGGFHYYESSTHFPHQVLVVNKWVHKLWDGARVKLKTQRLSSNPSKAPELKVSSND